ncbi:putative transcriptional regulator, TetR family protein [Dietzia sp. NCCP-2495]|uniref:TetR/AcrR family transcriptional regulator n=1 Tax=Dietzia sp. NCCP-2495 TaxID=2934675 RepID=UPI002231D2C4|nr:TetR/AcrR family transcriptional regulator [Dietzia sp. NCCP-2495]GLB63024.1 putative transcriptional regulator, TetR family protein [Dietzia sp. NCCP-2495]
MTDRTTSARPAPSARPTTRDRALEAAYACALELGIDRTTMIEVARRSGVGRTTLYRHWSDATSLLTDLLTRELTETVTRINPGAAHPGPAGTGTADPDVPDPDAPEPDLVASHHFDSGAPRDADEIVDLVCTLADRVRTNPLLEAMRRHETGMLGEYLLRRLGTSQRALVDMLREMIAASADPRLTDRDPAATATMLYLALQGTVLSAPLADPPLDPDTWRAELHRLIRGYLLP